MFIAHIPAGYILTKKLQKYFKSTKYLALGLVASVLPDLDLLYFYLVDNRQNLHHGYWVHIPFYWLIIAAFTFSGAYLFGKKKYLIPAVIFFACIFLHMVLDSFVAGVQWLFPITEKSFYLFTVPAVYDWWVWNFFFHWTFLLEVAILVWAGKVLLSKK
jgi:inner membrane protein